MSRHQSRGCQVPSLCSSASLKTEKLCENNDALIYMIGCLLYAGTCITGRYLKKVYHIVPWQLVSSQLVVSSSFVRRIQQCTTWQQSPALRSKASGSSFLTYLNHTKCQSQEEICFFLLSEYRRPCGQLHHSSPLMPCSRPAMELNCNTCSIKFK